MTRPQLEHIIRAAAATANVRDIVVIGSQAILGSIVNPPQELTKSIEADVFPREAPQRSIVIDGAIGELSLFHETFGYYAHGVDETTATLPSGWQSRLVKLKTPATQGAIGWCLDPHDLAISKLTAGREKDLEFVAVMLKSRLTTEQTLSKRLADVANLASQRREIAMAWLERYRKE